MKGLFLILTIASSSTFASQMPNPLLVRETFGPTVAPRNVESSKCEVFANRIVMTNTVGEMTAVTSKNVNLTDDKILEAITEAKKGHVSKSTGPVGGPNTFYKGVLTVGASAPDYVTLKTTGVELSTNSAPEAGLLVRLIEAVCN